MKLSVLLYSYDNREPALRGTLDVRSVQKAIDSALATLAAHRQECQIGCHLDSWTIDRKSPRTSLWEVVAHGRLADERAA